MWALLVLLIMPLPTTNLTGHFDASQNSSPVTMYNDDAGTSAATDGQSVRQHRDQGDGSISTHLDRVSGSEVGPTWLQVTPIMKLPCLRFGFSGTRDQLAAYQTDDSTTRPMTDFVTTTALCMAAVYYPQTVNDTHTAAVDAGLNDFLLGHTNVNCFFGLYNNGGTPNIRAAQFDSAYRVVDYAIALNRTWISVMKFDGSTLTHILIDDGGSEQSNSIACTTIAAMSQQFVYGKSAPAGPPFYTGLLGEFALYNADVTGSDLTNLKQYFKDKWLTLTVTPLDWIVARERPTQYSQRTMIDSGPRPGRDL